MRKILLGLIFSTLFFSASSQKCRVSTLSTGETLISFDFKGRSVYYEQKNAVTFLEFLVAYSGESSRVVNKGYPIVFILENNDSLVTFTSDDTHPKKEVNFAQTAVYGLTNYAYKVGLSKEEIFKLAASPIKLIRYPDTYGGALQFVPKGKTKKWTGAFLKGAQCMRSNL